MTFESPSPRLTPALPFVCRHLHNQYAKTSYLKIYDILNSVTRYKLDAIHIEQLLSRWMAAGQHKRDISHKNPLETCRAQIHRNVK